ncbi:MAG: NAD(P)-dependent oxidoreductase [Chloroflexi bacterium]|nr:NAD(P)-dependent oxidoreductase [Chloroflexota bacterium]MCH8234643.1 NAD(P)-dependent oxidoreductase [Chloroflexota bacterium]MCH8816113.1 NAD(P)-dependent oxidoreductase [Chloroflexota bacterium]
MTQDENGGKRVLVTGMSGLIGGLVGRSLAQNYYVRALNRRPVEGVDCVQADIADLDAIRPAFEGIDTVVHMAAYLGPEFSGQVSGNLIGAYNVFEAAREAGVKRVIFASSGATQALYEMDEPIKAMVEARWDDVPQTPPIITPQDPPRPNGVYGAAKLWGEALGRYYSDAHGMSVICIRIGRVVKEDRPYDARHAAVYCSQRDVVQMVEKCVSADDSVRFDLFYAVSNNRGRFRDIQHARDIIGYVPQDGISDWPMEQPG